jgi:uncharacterized protein (DUF2141 family)
VKKAIVLILLGCILASYCFSQSAHTVEITNVVVNGGVVYLYIFSTAEGFKNGNPYLLLALEANDSNLSKEILLPDGEYVFSPYQDANNNKKLDYNLFGVPKELIGMSNYFGKGYPSKNFDRHKITINNSTGKITIGLYKM